VAAIASAAGAWIHDWAVWYADVDTATMLGVGVAMAVSAIVLTGLGSYWLTRALRQAGVLEGFPAGR
jgi:ABC-type thiamin/hydroxymethylpyrimidine transport system permease subunit